MKKEEEDSLGIQAEGKLRGKKRATRGKQAGWGPRRAGRGGATIRSYSSGREERGVKLRLITSGRDGVKRERKREKGKTHLT